MSSVSQVSPAEELAAFLSRSPTPREIATFRLSDAALDPARELMDKNDDGTLTPDESHELDRMILLDDVIVLIQSQVPATEAERPDTTLDDGGQTPKARASGSAG